MDYRKIPTDELGMAMDRAYQNFYETDPEGTERLWAALPPQEIYLHFLDGHPISSYGAYEGEELIGAIFFEGDEILMLYTEKERRGCGVGRFLLEERIKQASGQDISVRADPSAQAFYEACGFLVVGEEGGGIRMVYRKQEERNSNENGFR